jgi:glycosyltransferase involved in cell wall biosynthesis/SAM-dependent methyltransferase
MSSRAEEASPASVALAVCPVCGGVSFGNLGQRSDGIPVLLCGQCGMGFVAQRPADTAVFYTDEYYRGGGIAGVGYDGYESVSTHSLAWAARLVRLLRPHGRVLDVGCADGLLLRMLGDDYEAYGIEVNEGLASGCAARGVRMLGRDICDPGLQRLRGHFDVITAIATLEHVADLRLALLRIRELLAVDGVLLFEVPLLSDREDNSVWFQSSLEHVYYPTRRGLEHLFQDVFALPLLGREAPIRNYASTFVGLAVRDGEQHRQLGAWFERLLEAPIAALPAREERLFRLYFDLVHRAATNPDSVAVLAELPPEQLQPEILRRLVELWKTDLARGQSLLQLLEQRGDLAHVDLADRAAAAAGALESERANRARLAQQLSQWQELAQERGEELTRLATVVELFESRLGADGRMGTDLQERLSGTLRQLTSEREAMKSLTGALAQDRERAASAEVEAQASRARLRELEEALESARAEARDAEGLRDELRAIHRSRAWRVATKLWSWRMGRRRRRRLPRPASDRFEARVGTALWSIVRLGYRGLPMPERVRSRFRATVRTWLSLPAGAPSDVVAARLRGLFRGFTWRRAASASALLLRGDVAGLKLHVGQFVRHSVGQETRCALSATPAASLVRRQQARTGSQPLLSVIVVCYNYGRFVAEAVDSILAQTFQNFEILVVDGGSSAETLEVLRNFERPKTRVFLRGDRHLVGDNRNFGIAHARGRYVCCLDADDKLKPTYLEKALFLLETQGYDVVSTSIQSFGGQSDIYHLERFPVLADMVRGNHVSTCAVFGKELWERAGGYRDAGLGRDYVYEDWRLWVRLSALGARIANIVEEPLFLYRVHETSLSRQREVPSIDEQRQAVVELNHDVIDDEAFRVSQANRELAVRIEDGLANLGTGRDSSATTILIALPFLLVGGAERLVSELAVHLSRRGFRLVVVTTEYVYPEYGDSTAWFDRATAEIYQLPRFLEPSRWHEFIRYLFATRDIALLWIVGSRVAYDLLPELKAAHSGLKVIDLLFNTVGHAASNRRYAEHFDRILVENREVAEWLAAAGEPRERVVQIASGVDVETYRPRSRPAELLAQLGVAADSFVVGFSGRLAEEKDPEAFLEIARLCRPESRLVFVMTGAGPLADQVARRLEKLRLGDRFRFLGQVERVVDTMAAYDVFVLPSRFDGRPIAVLESLALGVPVVASRVGALPDLIQDGRTGFLCEPGDVAAFARRIRWLAAHPEEHRRMKVAARAFAEANLDARPMCEAYEAAIRGVLSAPGRSPTA